MIHLTKVLHHLPTSDSVKEVVNYLKLMGKSPHDPLHIFPRIQLLQTVTSAEHKLVYIVSHTHQ